MGSVTGDTGQLHEVEDRVTGERSRPGSDPTHHSDPLQGNQSLDFTQALRRNGNVNESVSGQEAPGEQE